MALSLSKQLTFSRTAGKKISSSCSLKHFVSRAAKTCRVIAFLFFCLICSQHWAFSQISPIVPASHDRTGTGSPYENLVGVGIDSLTGKTKTETCVNFQKIEGGKGGQLLSYTKHEVKSEEQLYNALGLALGARYSFAATSVSGAFNYAKSFSLSRTENVLVMRQEVLNPEIRGYVPRPSQAALNAAKRGPKIFHEICGDAFVLAVNTGGSLTIVAKFKNETSREESNARATVDANVGTGGGTLKLTEQFNKAIAKSEVSLDVFRNGTKDNVPDDKNLETYARMFPPKVASGTSEEALVHFETRLYKEIDGLPDTVRYSINDQLIILANLATTISKHKRLLGEINSVFENAWQFEHFDAATLNTAKAIETETIKKLEERARKCYGNLPAPCANDDLNEPPNITLPERLFAAKLFAGAVPANFSMVSTDPNVRGLPTTFIGYALVKPKRPGDPPLYVGSSTAPCEATRIYGVYNPCQTLLGYATTEQKPGSTELFLGLLQYQNEGCVNSHRSFGWQGGLGGDWCELPISVGGSSGRIIKCRSYGFTAIK